MTEPRTESKVLTEEARRLLKQAGGLKRLAATSERRLPGLAEDHRSHAHRGQKSATVRDRATYRRWVLHLAEMNSDLEELLIEDLRLAAKDHGWGEVGRWFGMTRQAARERFSRDIPARGSARHLWSLAERSLRSNRLTGSQL